MQEVSIQPVGRGRQPNWAERLGSDEVERGFSGWQGHSVAALERGSKLGVSRPGLGTSWVTSHWMLVSPGKGT